MLQRDELLQLVSEERTMGAYGYPYIAKVWSAVVYATMLLEHGYGDSVACASAAEKYGASEKAVQAELERHHEIDRRLAGQAGNHSRWFIIILKSNAAEPGRLCYTVDCSDGSDSAGIRYCQQQAEDTLGKLAFAWSLSCYGSKEEALDAAQEILPDADYQPLDEGCFCGNCRNFCWSERYQISYCKPLNRAVIRMDSPLINGSKAFGCIYYTRRVDFGKGKR